MPRIKITDILKKEPSMSLPLESPYLCESPTKAFSHFLALKKSSLSSLFFGWDVITFLAVLATEIHPLTCSKS